MEIIDNMPKKVTLVGNPCVLKEELPRNEKNIGRDIIPESNIVYPDLVFTIGHSIGKYFRPRVL